MCSVREMFQPVLDGYINENKRYILTEKVMSLKELTLRKMFPLYSGDMSEKFNFKNNKTYLGRKYKNGDKIVSALLIQSQGGDNFRVNIATLTEDEFDMYDVACPPYCKEKHIHTIKLKKASTSECLPQ